MTRRFELDGVRVDIEEIFGERISGETKYHGTHLWPSSVVLSAFLIKSKLSAGKNVLELGCGCGLPGTVAAWCGAKSVCLTDGFESGVASANHTLFTNVLPCPSEARLFKWSQEKNQTFEGVDLILAADCLYPDVSSWPDFFCTVSFILRSNPSCFLILAFHKRNNFLSIEPFLEFFKLESEEMPLRDFELDSESGIGGTNLPGPNTGSIQLFKVFKKDF